MCTIFIDMDNVTADLNRYVVEEVSSEGDYGNHVKITNGDVMTLYAHCNKIYVNKGDIIKQGQEIGEVGETGFK